MDENHKKQVRYDVDSFDVVTTALRELINRYPAIDQGDEIAFATLDEDGGKSMFPISGAVIETEREDITGHVTQICLYPFYVVSRIGGLSENRKATAKEWLDNLGKWLELQTIHVNGADHQLAGYPILTGNRKILSISRQTPAYLDNISENKIEDWAIYISARYRNEFDR